MEADKAKKKRLSLACNVCRKKKIKCDGVKPACGKCVNQKQECTYSTGNKKRGPRQGHIELLEKRLKKMEEIMTSGASNKAIQLDPSLAEPWQECQISRQQQLPKISSQIEAHSTDALPSTDVIQHLVDTYFQKCVATVPIIDVEGFKSSVRNNTCNLFLLYSIMAVAARYSTRADIVESPLWMSGERYAMKARAMIGQVVDNSCIENVQGLIVLITNEYGCGRGPRIWMYVGIAIRMSIEIGLHKEKIFDEGNNPLLSLDIWYWYETRRKVFWEILIQDKFSSAATGKPSVLDSKDCEIMLPVDFDILGNSSGNDFYQTSLDQTKLVHYHIVRDESTKLITGIQMNPLNVNDPEHRVYLNRVGWSSRILQATVLLGKVTKFVNGGTDDDSPYRVYENNLEFEKLDSEVDAWVKMLPLYMKNTPANLERYRNSSDVRSIQYVIGHMLHNSLIILLHRPSLVVVDLPGFNQVTQELQDKVHKSMEKCLAAADNVTVMIKDLCCQIEVIPPFIAYSVYISATIVVNNIFTGNSQENKQAEAAIKEYFRFLSGMRIYWAMADKLYFMICDLYAIHQKVVNTFQNSQAATVTSSNSSTSWNNYDKNSFLSPYPNSSSTPASKGNLANASPISGMKNNQTWDSQGNGFFLFQTNNEQERRRSIFTDPSSASLPVPSFDIWLRQQQQNRSSL